MIGRLYRALIHRLSQLTFTFWQRLGLHVVPNHFYFPIPDTRQLTPDLWTRLSDLPGIDLRDAEQAALLERLTRDFAHEYNALPRQSTGVPHQYYLDNGNFTFIDGEILYAMIRHAKPRRIYEIGSGFSTLLAAQAVLKNEAEGQPCELVAFEPYPRAMLRGGFPGLSRLVETPIQKIPLTEFAQLQANDILFIDSTHVLKLGSDVQYEFLEILPRLNPGVLIHVHDIFLPAEYPREWILKNHWFWTEQYLLQAFLVGNRDFEVLWAGHYQHRRHPDRLAQAFASYDHAQCFPGSFWLRRV